jgi:hypothetical protein
VELRPIMSRPSTEWGGIYTSADLPIIYTALTALGFKPSLRGEEPVTKGLSYGKAIFHNLPDRQCCLNFAYEFRRIR